MGIGDKYRDGVVSITVVLVSLILFVVRACTLIGSTGLLLSCTRPALWQAVLLCAGTGKNDDPVHFSTLLCEIVFSHSQVILRC